MVCPKKEETTAAPMSGQQEKHCGPWWKSRQQQQHHHHHHHHHHHVQLNGMTWELIPQEKQGHCHRGRSWWGHHKDVHSEATVKPKCFFRSLRDKQNCEKSDKRFDYSENYN